MLIINKIYKKYGKNFSLNVENLKIPGNGVMALLGPNGSGKTTLLKILLGLVKPAISDITWMGNNITTTEDKFRDQLSYMPQTAIFPHNLKVGEIMEIIKSLRPSVVNYDMELYSKFEIDSKINLKFSSLSQGTKQKIAAATAFLFDSRIIILDEPSAGLDPYATAVMKEKILKEKSRKLILFTTHIISDVMELAERFIFLHEGYIKLERELNNNDRLKGGSEFINEISSYFKIRTC